MRSALLFGHAKNTSLLVLFVSGASVGTIRLPVAKRAGVRVPCEEGDAIIADPEGEGARAQNFQAFRRLFLILALGDIVEH